MPITVSPEDFREFSKIPADESDSFLNSFINPATFIVVRATGKNIDDIRDSISMRLAVKLVALDLYNQRDFPSRVVSETVMSQVLVLVQGEIDLAGQTVLSEAATAGV